MDTESLKRAAGVLPPSGGKIDTTIANDLRANPNESMKRDVGIPMLLDRDGINYALESNQNIADTAEKARAAHKVTTNARSKIVDSTNRYRDSIDSQVNKAQPIVDSTVNTKALPAIDSAASRIKSTLRSKIQPSSVSNQTSNPTPTPTPTPNIVPQVKSRTPRISVPKPVPQPKPIQQPRPVTQLAKQGSDMLSYKLGALKAIKNFSKQANIPVSAVLKLAPQILNPANIEKAKQLLSPKSAKKFAPGLLGLETANIVSKAHAEQLAKAKSALGLVKSPTTVEELLAQHTANQKALEGLNQEMADNPTMSAILKHQFEEKLKTTSPEINTSIINYMQNKGIGKLLEESVLANPMSGIKSIFNL
jgi:hypothetical protein